MDINEEFEIILKKVAGLYHKYGIKSVTMDDIAHELGISKKTIYKYVGEKEELVKQVSMFIDKKKDEEVFHHMTDTENAIEELLEVNSCLNKFMQEASPSYMYDMKKYYPEIFQEWIVRRRGKMYDAVLTNLKRGKKEGIYRDDLNEEIIARLQLMRFENINNSELFSTAETHSSNFFMEIFVYHIRGIANEKGLKILQNQLKKLEEKITDNNVYHEK